MDIPRTSSRVASVTRPANATTYTAKDAIGSAASSGAVLQFPPSKPWNRETGKVISARCWKSGTGVTNDGFTLYLFQKVPTATPVDHLAPTTEFVAIADASSYMGSIVFNAAGVVLAAGVYYEGEGTLAPTGGLPYQTDGGDGIIYGILTAVGAYEPTSAEVFTITLETQE